MKRFFIRTLIDVATCAPAYLVLNVGLKSLGFHTFGQIVVAVLLLTWNNLGRAVLNELRK